MAHALGSLDPSTCTHLEEAESLLVDSADPQVLSQVLIECGLLIEEDWKDMNMVSTILLM